MKLRGLIFITILFTGCTFTSENKIAGTWSMYRIIQDGQDVTTEHDPYDERYITFSEDSTFETGGRPYGTNTGKYIFNSEDHTLSLDSDAGPEDDSQWKVTFQGDRMHWQGVGSEWAEGFELIHLRKK